MQDFGVSFPTFSLSASRIIRSSSLALPDPLNGVLHAAGSGILYESQLPGPRSPLNHNQQPMGSQEINVYLADLPHPDPWS
jgi:hypothetical protein